MEVKDTMKNARKKVDVPMESAMPREVRNFWHGESRCEKKKNSTRRSRYARIVEAHEYTRTPIGKIEPRDHEDLLGVRLVDALQLGAQTDTHTPRNENSGCR